MRHHIAAVSLVLAVALVGVPAHTTGSFDTFDKAEYAGRRTRLMEKIGDGAAIFLGATTQASDTPSARAMTSST